MKKLPTGIASVLLLAGSFGLLARPQSPANGSSPHSSTAKKSLDVKEGERRFQENCGRCHTPPVAISPREAKAVVQHMRVRASLSKEDAELILHFLTP
jgi:hypothetical protein